MMGSPATVFISYSHRDESWKDRLVGHLRVLEFEGDLDVWDDRRIEAGDDWRPEIEQAIERATVAILIVSKDFLTSRFIREQELTRILSRRSRQELRVIPLIAEPCAWQAVSSLQGIQARPKDGRPLSGGSEHQIDADLAALALEIRDTPGRGAPARDLRAGRRRFGALVPLQSSVRLLAWLSLPSAVLALLTLGATYWPLQTHVSVDVVTRRVSFVVRGQRTQNLLNQSSQFSELTIERCATVSFSAAEVRQVEPVDKRSGANQPPYSGRVRFVCDDPGAKITLAAVAGSGSPVGVLDRVVAEPGATVVLESYGTTAPVLTLDVSTKQQLNLPIHRPLRIVSELARAEPSSLGSSSSLASYDARLPDADRMIQVQSAEEGIVLVIRPTADGAGDLLNARLPVESLQFVDEQIGGGISPPFLEEGKLSYPDYPGVEAIVVSKDEFLVLNRTTDMELRRVALQPDRPALRLTIEGNLAKGASIGRPQPGSATGDEGGRWFDPRLSLYQAVRHGSRWGAVAAVAAWAMATTWVGYERWKKLRGPGTGA